MIHANEDIRDWLKLLACAGETEDDVLQRLIKYIEEEDLEEIRGQVGEAAEGDGRVHSSGRVLMQVRVHPKVKKYLDECGEKQRLKEGLAGLSEDPFHPEAAWIIPSS